MRHTVRSPIKRSVDGEKSEEKSKSVKRAWRDTTAWHITHTHTHSKQSYVRRFPSG